MAKRIAVVGAGPSGLVTVKELAEEGHEPTCFERAAGLGGVFRFGEKDGVVWESCRLTSSPLLTSFSDFPAPADRVMHLRVGEYVDYLDRYCDAFDLSVRTRPDRSTWAAPFPIRSIFRSSRQSVSIPTISPGLRPRMRRRSAHPSAHPGCRSRRGHRSPPVRIDEVGPRDSRPPVSAV